MSIIFLKYLENYLKIKNKMNNETLSIKFTNLTSEQKATLQQMFAYLQECTRQGASRNVGFFWDAGWGMHGKVISEEITSCKIPLTPISSNKDIIFFDLSEGQTRKAKLKFNETCFINPWFEGADLKGCPFCGEMANLEILDDKKTGFRVRCKTCGSQCATKATKDEAIRELLLNQGETPCESFNQTINSTVLYMLYQNKAGTHDHAWQIKSWTAHGFWLWRKYDVICTCRICGYKLYFKRLNLKEWRELMTSQHDTKELTNTIDNLINKGK